MTAEAASVLVVDDDRGMRTTLVVNLEEMGYRMLGCASGLEAIRTIRETPPDLVLADLRLPDLDGLDILQALKEVSPGAAFILMTGYASVDTAVEALNAGAYAYITKPFNMDEVHSTIRNAIQQQRLLRESRRLLDSLQQTNRELAQEVTQRTLTEETLQETLGKVEVAYQQTTIYAEELREEVAQRRRAEDALARSEELRRLQAAQEARDQERKRLAEELHDQTLAELSSVVVDLGFLARTASVLPPDVESALSELRTRVRDAERGLRLMVQGLFPSVLTNLGLMPALRSFLEELAGRPIVGPNPLALELREIGLDDGRLPEEIEIAVYRVVQQGLVNTVQHAQARRLEVEISWEAAYLIVTISDDGIGFDMASLELTPTAGHFGLLNLRDRIEGLSGQLDIESEPLVGTTLRVKIPTQKVGQGTDTVQTSRYMLRSQGAA